MREELWEYGEGERERERERESALGPFFTPPWEISEGVDTAHLGVVARGGGRWLT